MSGVHQCLAGTYGTPRATESKYETAGSYTFVAPITGQISMVLVGASGSGLSYGPAGGAGGMTWANNYSVTNGDQFTVVVGAQSSSDATDGQSSTITPHGGSLLYEGEYGDGSGPDRTSGGGPGGQGGAQKYSGTPGVGGGKGGNGGDGNSSMGAPYPCAGGAGAGGYSGTGGDGANAGANSGTAGQGGGGGGGGGGQDPRPGYGWAAGGGGGGVGIFGEGPSGAGGSGAVQGSTAQTVGKGGSNGQDGSFGFAQCWGGNYGGSKSNGYAGNGYASRTGDGAVRIIWSLSGGTREFPSTNVGEA